MSSSSFRIPRPTRTLQQASSLPHVQVCYCLYRDRYLFDHGSPLLPRGLRIRLILQHLETAIWHKWYSSIRTQTYRSCELSEASVVYGSTSTNGEANLNGREEPRHITLYTAVYKMSL
ncbi:hypothetical protein CCHR01_06508 [Colletotrichum chrysophilum]|uniref:Uncharacterized protein n=1 Tax=Colletotrichum chrysophilum TaxID=1836956 RepID=A0AAD9AME2_9PEZI|nr:hypothetical protein CCHR01_06508 [Colletotrichum chrysophilum]